MWAKVVNELTSPPPRAAPIGQPQAIVWDRHVFTSDRQLERFLTRQGISYTAWVSRHPDAYAVVKHKLPASALQTTARPRAHAATQPTTAKVTPTKPAREVADASASGSAKSRSATRSASGPAAGGSSTRNWTLWLALVLVVASTLLGASALVPAAASPHFLRRVYRSPERRVYVAAAATSILITLLVSLYLR